MMKLASSTGALIAICALGGLVFLNLIPWYIQAGGAIYCAYRVSKWLKKPKKELQES